MDRRCRCYGRLEIRRDADRFVWSRVVIVERLGIGSLGLAAHWGVLGCGCDDCYWKCSLKEQVRAWLAFGYNQYCVGLRIRQSLV